MAKLRRRIALSVALAAISLVLAQIDAASAQTPTPTYSPSPTPSPSASPSPSPSPSASPSPTPTGAGSSGGSIGDLGNQRFNQMITNRVLGTVLLGVNEQINCSDCISAFGSAGSFSAGIHGRKEITPNLSLLAGIAYTQYSEGGYSVTSAPIGAFALRYDFTDWGSSRPFFDVGAVLTPWEKVRYRRSYMTSLGAVSVDGQTDAGNYGAYGRAGWISRLSPRDEVAASIEVWQLWQRVNGYTRPGVGVQSVRRNDCDRHRPDQPGQDRRPVDASVRPVSRATSTAAMCSPSPAHSGIVATMTGDGTVVPTMGNQGWFEYGGRLGFRITKGWVADLFVNGTLGPQPVGNTIHGGVGLRVNY